MDSFRREHERAVLHEKQRQFRQFAARRLGVCYDANAVTAKTPAAPASPAYCAL